MPLADIDRPTAENTLRLGGPTLAIVCLGADGSHLVRMGLSYPPSEGVGPVVGEAPKADCVVMRGTRRPPRLVRLTRGCGGARLAGYHDSGEGRGTKNHHITIEHKARALGVGAGAEERLECLVHELPGV